MRSALKRFSSGTKRSQSLVRGSRQSMASLLSPARATSGVEFSKSTAQPRTPSAQPATEKTNRRRRSSSLLYQEPTESMDHISNQAALPNLNSEWVNAKGAWAIHIVLISLLKIFYSIIPLASSQEASWTMTNISYMAGSYLMFHWVRGVPFDFNAGAYDNLNLWEQIDNGDQYTPAKKFLLAVPILLFLLSTHYTHYDFTYFTINFLATLAVVIPKLPALHRMRLAIFSGVPEDR